MSPKALVYRQLCLLWDAYCFAAAVLAVTPAVYNQAFSQNLSDIRLFRREFNGCSPNDYEFFTRGIFLWKINVYIVETLPCGGPSQVAQCSRFGFCIILLLLLPWKLGFAQLELWSLRPYK